MTDTTPISEPRSSASATDTVRYRRRFLARPSRTDGSLLLAVLHNDHVMVDRVFREPRPLTIGSEPVVDIGLPDDAVGRAFQLVELADEKVWFRLPRGADVELYIGDTRVPEYAWGSVPGAREERGAVVVPVTLSTRIALTFGDTLIMARPGVAPRLRTGVALGSGGPSPLFVGVSAIVHALLLALVYLVPTHVGAAEMDAFTQPDRFAALLQQSRIVEARTADLFPQEPESDETTAQGEGESSATGGGPDGGGDDAPGDGRRSSDRAQNAGEPGGDTPGGSTRPGSMPVSDLGALAVLGDSSAIFGDSAVDDPMLDAFAAVGPGQTTTSTACTLCTGDGLGPRRGRPGFDGGPIRVGPPGGRNADDDHTRLARIERDPEHAPVPAVGIGSEGPTIDGSLSRDIIRRVIREHRREIRACYERELRQDPELAGRVAVDFVITSTGTVPSASVAESDLGSDAVESCIERRVRQWRFPEADAAGITRIRYPFVFSTGR